MANKTTFTNRTPAIAIVFAWLIVGIPAAWGIYNTGLNAKKLFAPAPPAVIAPATPVR